MDVRHGCVPGNIFLFCQWTQWASQRYCLKSKSESFEKGKEPSSPRSGAQVLGARKSPLTGLCWLLRMVLLCSGADRRAWRVGRLRISWQLDGWLSGASPNTRVCSGHFLGVAPVIRLVGAAKQARF